MYDKNFNANVFLTALDRYISQVQDEIHARRGRVAMFWSLVSLLYIAGWMEVEKGLQFSAFGISFPGLNIPAVLFAITAYYAVRFYFSVAKICVSVNPWELWRALRFYKKLEKSGFDFHSLGHDDVEFYEQVKGYDDLRQWDSGETPMQEKYPEYMKAAAARGLGEDPQKLFEVSSKMRSGSFPRRGTVDMDQVEKNRDAVRHHNLRHPQISLWENFVFLMIVPIAVCSVTMLIFFGVFAYHAAKFVMQFWH